MAMCAAVFFLSDEFCQFKILLETWRRPNPAEVNIEHEFIQVLEYS